MVVLPGYLKMKALAVDLSGRQRLLNGLYIYLQYVLYLLCCFLSGHQEEEALPRQQLTGDPNKHYCYNSKMIHHASILVSVWIKGRTGV